MVIVGYSVVLRFSCSCARCRRCISTEIKYHHYHASRQQIIIISYTTYYDGTPHPYPYSNPTTAEQNTFQLSFPLPSSTEEDARGSGRG